MSTTQHSLFERPVPRARNSDPETSHAAADSVVESARTQRARIHGFLIAHGPHTADELDLALNLRITSAGRRLPELQERGLAQPLDGTRTTRTGREARLWAANKVPPTRE